MYYRVVMQGRTLGGADLDEVKRNFIRVTGLPAGVAEKLFGGMPQVVRRQVPESDAERIAATLRAIGAAAIVERELGGEEEETAEEIRILANPLNAGPPTVIPGSQPTASEAATPTRLGRWLRKAKDNGPVLLGGAGLIAGAVLVAPFAGDYLAQLRRSPAPVTATAKPALPAPSSEQAAALNATLLHGPWRCTDQRTGVATYWSYDPDGTIVYHGDVLTDRHAPQPSNAAVPNAWKVDGRRLVQSYAQRAPDTYAIDTLTLSRLRYGNDRGIEIECRRP